MGLGLTLGIYGYKKSNRLPRNRGKTINEPVLYKALPVYTEDKNDAFFEDESTQPLEAEGNDTVNFTGVKQQQSQSEPTRSAFPCLKLTTFAAE